MGRCAGGRIPINLSENDDSFPEPVANALRAIGTHLSSEVSVAWLDIPPLRLRLRRADGLPVSLIGPSFVAVFRKQAGP